MAGWKTMAVPREIDRPVNRPHEHVKCLEKLRQRVLRQPQAAMSPTNCTGSRTSARRDTWGSSPDPGGSRCRGSTSSKRARSRSSRVAGSWVMVDECDPALSPADHSLVERIRRVTRRPPRRTESIAVWSIAAPRKPETAQARSERDSEYPAIKPPRRRLRRIRRCQRRWRRHRHP